MVRNALNCSPLRLATFALSGLFFFFATAIPQLAHGQHKHTNRLAKETSPYLIQHAHNPVDWYPWGEEALGKAIKEDKLIFLSIGYSSCHWCHVMEHESFMDEEIAKYMNDHFVCIKVDREERPDVDSIYMTSVQMLTRRGGWPLSVFLTPKGHPFFGGTYFPARDGDRGSASGFLTILKRIDAAWKNDRINVEARAEAVAEAVKTSLEGDETQSPVAIKLTSQLRDRATAGLTKRFDPQHGGFGFDPDNPEMPKFPMTPTLNMLLHAAQEDDEQSRAMLLVTLDNIAMGGMRDHLGGGFHRYCVDRFWLIPHFEKMLYDNGQLLSVFAGATQLTGIEQQRRAEYEQVIEELVAFVDRNMTSPEGAFYSAMDADSEGEEGKFYRWTKDEWQAELGDETAALFASAYAAQGEPNFEEKFYYPQLLANRPVAANEIKLTVEQFETQLRPVREQLRQLRSRRKPPLTDTKILTGWNGLMIRGLADAGRILQKPELVTKAEKAAKFVLAELRDDRGRLRRTFSAGEARLGAYLDDYAYLVDGLIGLHQATGDEQWLEEARTLTDKQIELFWDQRRGGFYFTAADHEALIARGKLVNGGPRPSGAAVSASNLIYLAMKSKPEVKGDYLDRSRKTIESAGRALIRYPSEAPRMVQAAMELLEAEPAPIQPGDSAP